jgi:hypothetical protein
MPVFCNPATSKCNRSVTDVAVFGGTHLRERIGALALRVVTDVIANQCCGKRSVFGGLRSVLLVYRLNRATKSSAHQDQIMV